MNSRPQETPVFEGFWLGERTTQYALVGIAFGIVFPVIATLLKLSELGLPTTIVNVFNVQLTERVLWITDTAPFFLGLVAGIAGRQHDRILEANRVLREREAELTATRSGLEQSIEERTRELDRRNAQMRAVIEFARQAADVQDLQSLLNGAADFIGHRFEQFSALLYLLDEAGHNAVLRAASRPAGKAQVKEGVRLVIGDQSPVGRVARRGKMLIIQPRTERVATSSAPAPATQITLPLVVRGRVIGVLDLKADSSVTVSAMESETLQLIADQLAASIENTRLAMASRASVNQLEALAAQGTRTAWQDYLKSRALAFRYTPAGVSIAPDAPKAADALEAPVMLRGQPIGSLSLRRRPGATWGQPEQELIDKVAAQVALALENARLLEETSQKAAQEQIISEISARLNRSLEVDAVLQAAVREFASLPEVAEAEVRIAASDDTGTPAVTSAR